MNRRGMALANVLFLMLVLMGPLTVSSAGNAGSAASSYLLLNFVDTFNPNAGSGPLADRIRILSWRQVS